ncbi:MAG: hypothetical protein A2W99_13750 [Bacteroidetes bacterium GWF2_33_16]|nr:MAG: hypothetical protein A2X00_09050 [Bacteroidetes bacterium GWE2_32_14]OFY04567.1 MAG: hypothetical protein A2W99_13750 [Bacteroidetes bacterium GWF2_33_16]
MKNIKLTIVFFFLISWTLKAQDTYFSQFYAFPIYLSPSLAGATEQMRVTSIYRNQWANLPNAYITYAFSIDHYIRDYKSGIGAIVVRNQEGGVYNNTSIGLSYNYTIKINNELNIRPGIFAATHIQNIDYSSLEFADQLSRSSPTSVEVLDKEQVQHYDFAVSALAYTSKYWFGATGDHLMALNKQISYDNTYPSLKIVVYGGAKFELFKRVRSQVDRFFSLSFLYKTQAGFHQFDLGTNFEREPYRVGVWLRGSPGINESFNINAIVLLAGVTVKDILINYSYDITLSRLLSTTGGAHEISLSYRFDVQRLSNKKKKMAALPCPTF